MDPYEEVTQQGQATPVSPAYVPNPMELEHHILVYVLDLGYPEYLALSDDDISVEDQPLPADASLAALSPGYVSDSDLEDDSIDYAANADDNEEEEGESFKDDDDEEEHLDPSDSTAIASPAVDHTPIPFPSKEDVARLLALPTPPPSPLTTLSSSLPQIPSPPLPLPSPPTHTSPTYAEAPLGYRADGIRLRAASPLPLPAPSTSHRADISKANIPPRKRLCLTAPTPRFKVREGSAAARQPRSTVAQVVNLRVSYQANVRRRESEEFYTRHQDAQGDRAALRDEVDTLRSLTCIIFLVTLKKMPPKKRTATTTTTTTPMTDAQLKALIAQGVSDALAQIEANKTSRNGDDNHDSGTGSKRTKRPTRENKKPEIEMWNLKVKGTDVVSYKQCFQELSLMCSRMFPDESDEIDKYVGGLPDMIHGSVMASKPKTMQDAIEFATKLMDQKILTLAER
nr:reverse transcriptase domain-containing protein [Tanacetum cinerariifolium]